MASNFPGTSVDSFATLTDGTSTVLAAQQNDRAAAIVAAQTKVGVDADPRSAVTVEGRLKQQEARLIVSTTEPTSPQANDRWLDPSADPAVEVYWDGAAWQPIGSAGHTIQSSGVDQTAEPAVNFGPAFLVADAAGVATDVDLDFGTPALTFSTSAADGTGDVPLRADAQIALFDATAPSTQAIGDSAATGSAGKAARRDHKHALPAFATTSDLADVAATEAAGSATTVPHGDHVHALGTAIVTDTHVAAANKDGTTGTASLRTLGTGAQQAAAGNHTHGGGAGDATSLQGVAIDATLATTDGYVLTYVSANSDLELLPASGGGGGGGFGQLSPLSPPEGTTALPTWINQGGATATDESDGLYLLGVADSNNQIRGKYHSYTAPKTITAAFLPFLRGNGNSNVGLSITDGTTNAAKAINFEVIQSSAVAKVAVEYWTAVAGGSVSNTQLVEMSMHHGPMIWMQIEDDNTNLIFRLSSDGVHFPIVVLTVGRTAHLTPSHAGIMTNAFGATVLSAMKCLHWSIA